MREVVGPDRHAVPRAQVDAALGGGYSAVLYGSAARGDFVPGQSDLNLMLILDDLSPARAPSAGPAPSAPGGSRGTSRRW